jgi:hypothetical protein
MTNGSWIAMSVLAGLMATSAAQASLITIDADGYAAGTNLSNSFPGVTLSHVTFTAAGKQTSNVYAAPCSSGAACTALGAASFGRQNAAGTNIATWYSTASYIRNCLTTNYSYCYAEPQHLLGVTFDDPTDYVQFDSTYGSDYPDVWAFDAAGNLLTVTRSITIHATPMANGYGHQTVTLSSASSNIAGIYISGNGGSSTVNAITWDAP